VMHEAIRNEPPMDERMRQERAREARTREGRAREEHGPRETEEARGDWTYFTGPTQTGEAAPGGKVGHVYTNDDVTRQNDKNGEVKYDNKTEKF
jgi:hypothetical protein